MSDFDNLDDIFDDDFDLDQDAAVSIDNIDQELLEDDEEEGLNRTFLFAGMSLFGTFAAIVAAVVVLAGGGEDTSAIETAAAIETFNALQFTQAAETAVAIENLSTLSAEETGTAVANTTNTAIAIIRETEDAGSTQVAATRTQIAVAATQTQFAEQTAVAAELTANAPTPRPEESFRFEIRDQDGNPLPPGSVIQVFQDDGDGEFDPQIVPTAQPTATPGPGPTLTPASDDATDVPAVEEDPTAAAQTLEAQISEFDRLATQRAEEAANATPTLAPTGTPTPTPPEDDTTETDPTPVAEDTGGVVDTDVTTIVAGNGEFSIEIPAAWLVEDDVATESAELRFADEQAFLDSVSIEQPLAADVGTGGIISVVSGQQADELTIDIFQGVLTDALNESGAEFVEPIAAYDHPNIDLVQVGTVQGEGQQGYVAILGSGDTLLLLLLATSADNFEADAAQLTAILDSIQIPASGVSFMPAPAEGQVFLMRYDPGAAQSGPFQGGPTPPPDGDEPGIPVVIEPDGTGTITLPGEPGTYFLVLELPPGTYTLFIEGQEIQFTVIEGETTEAVVILADRTLIIRSFGTAPDATPPTPIPSATPTLDIPIQDTPISPFLQTATANARDVGPEVVTVTATVIVTATAIPQAGLFSEDGTATTEGLTMLALMGVGLLGIVFIVRRLRSSMEA